MIGVAIIGCGSIGLRHASIIREASGFELRAVCDSNKQAAEKMRSSAATSVDLAIASHWSELAEVDCDLVVICLPHFLHVPVAMAMVDLGRDVLIEKPLSNSLVQSDQLVCRLSTGDSSAWVVKQNRYNPSVQLVRSLVRSGALGELLQADCTVFWNRNEDYYSASPWRGSKEREGGVLFTIGCHFIDALAYMIETVGRVHYSVVRRAMHQHSIEDTGASLLTLTSGAVVSLSWSTCAFRENLVGGMTLLFEKGCVVLSGTALERLSLLRVDSADIQPEHAVSEWIRKNGGPAGYEQYRGTIDNHRMIYWSLARYYLQGEEDDRLGSLAEARDVVWAIEEIYRRSPGLASPLEKSDTDSGL